MRTSTRLIFAVSLLGSASLGFNQAWAKTILIENQGAKWKLGGTAVSPLPVNDVEKGDIIEFKINGTHGVVTLDKPGNQTPSPKLDLVLACGEDPSSKPNAVLRETECGATSQFNKVTTSVKFEVTDKFQGDVHFWCIIHKSEMWGTFKLRS